MSGQRCSPSDLSEVIGVGQSFLDNGAVSASCGRDVGDNRERLPLAFQIGVSVPLSMTYGQYNFSVGVFRGMCRSWIGARFSCTAEGTMSGFPTLFQ